MGDLLTGFRLLNLKNDMLRKKYDSLKYDLKKVEEVVYDISIRGLLKEQEEREEKEKREKEDKKDEGSEGGARKKDGSCSKGGKDSAAKKEKGNCRGETCDLHGCLCRCFWFGLVWFGLLLF